nr:bestrophin family ion channel [Elizabethkingia sp. JS20170427COW]
MVVYNPKDWFKAIFQIHKSDTFCKLFPFIILVGICSYGIAYCELEYLKLNKKSWVKNIISIHSLLGFVLSLLLVFRTNTAYDRWWEARKQWGALTNTLRTLSIKLYGILEKEDKENRKIFRRIIPMYANSLLGFLKSDFSTYMLDLKIIQK